MNPCNNASTRVLVAGLLGAALTACGGNDDPVSTLACTDLTTARLNIANLKVASAVEVAASGALPAHCKLNASLNARTGIDGKPYAIGFELRTPLAAAWNGKFFFQGGGGTNGVIVPATGNLLNAASGHRAGTRLRRGQHRRRPCHRPIGRGLRPGPAGPHRLRLQRGRPGHRGGQADPAVPLWRSGPAAPTCSAAPTAGATPWWPPHAYADQFDGFVAANPGFNLPQGRPGPAPGIPSSSCPPPAPASCPRTPSRPAALNLVAQKHHRQV